MANSFEFHPSFRSLVSKQQQKILLAMSVVTGFCIYLIYASTVANSAMDPYKALHVILNPNGTLTRLSVPPQSPPSPDPTLPNPVLSKDLTNHSIIPPIPIPTPNYPSSCSTTVVAFSSAALTPLTSTNSMSEWPTTLNPSSFQSTTALPRSTVSPRRTMTPWRALHWIKASNDPWLRHADYSRSYIMGESAGGNIAYTVGLRAAAEVDQMKPLRIKGLILIQPFFGGNKRTPSEIRFAEDQTIPLPVTDLMWNLSLPVGVDRDYEYSNPTIKGGVKILDRIKGLGWRVAVLGCEGDPLVDREKELVRLLQHKGLHVVGLFYEGGRDVKVFDLLKTLH